ncbi:polymorphic toxin-type HINT domain-containing protein [Kitasatospora sp. NBC_01246]|uniref:RHS repeat-associated core domain-containing protein n=1 Tax=Kitasatospora sp. NBC_01246 TaxID=2903570 RepID=UPI002E322EB7|nr:RHS repeat-associated core domain-containing protein [Kitasatospora sp. NBC_01246]
MAVLLALAMTGVAVPPAVAWTIPEPEGEVWIPPTTPLGDGNVSVEGRDARPSGVKSAAKPADWNPEAAAPVVTGTETITIGPDSAEAKAARSATGGASPASGGATGAKAGALAVQIAPGNGTGESAHTVTVHVAGQDKGKAAGVTTPLIAVSDADPTPKGDGRTASVTVDLKALQATGWSDRAALVSLPACALNTPDRPECRTQTPVPSRSDGNGKVTADVTLPPVEAQPTPGKRQSGTVRASFATMEGLATAPTAAGGTASPLVLAAAPTPSGRGGTYTATPLSPSSAWSAGSNAGNFTYNYPIQAPPALGGAAPAVGLGYNSAAVDGKTSATNSQSSWIGDGWGYEPGFIERSYRNCDKAGITGSADQCWGGQNATLSLGAHSGTIVRDDSTGTWHLQNDDGSRIEQLTGAPRATGDIDYQGMEYWRITTTDGVQYYFGRNHLPEGDGTDPAAGSVLTTPVYSPNSGDPCYSATSGNGSWCQMAWRWQLDYVVDPHGNLTTYRYLAETNKYNRGGAPNGNGTLTDYQRAVSLREIGYGQRLDDQRAARGTLDPAAKILFKTEERCKPSGAILCSEDQRNAANADAWPDVPIDQICTTAPCVNNAPTFFTTKRLTEITTQVLVSAAYRTVDTWKLNQSFPDPKDATKRTLWLDSIQRVPSNGQAPIENLPAVTFDFKMIANRVDGTDVPEHMFMRPRIKEITTETGGRINVIYSEPECSRVSGHMPASADNNTMACMPVKWYLPGQSSSNPVDDWFNKPLVKTVTEQDLVSSPAIGRTTEYTYNGGAAWHRNDAEFTDPKTRTWDSFRGYQSVTTTSGSGSISEAPKTQQTATYLRGMDGDYLAGDTSQRSVQVASPLGGSITDSDWLSGRVIATEVYDQAGGTVQAISGTFAQTASIDSYDGHPVTSTHAQTAGAPKIYARYPDNQVTAISKSKLANGDWRTASGTTTSDPSHGNRVVQTDDKGDGSTATPETCTTTKYANSGNPQQLALASERVTIQGTCGPDPTAANTISASRTLYDGRPFRQAGTTGDPTSSQVLDHFDSAGKPVYSQSNSATFDAYGRSTSTATPDGSTYGSDGEQLTSPSVSPAITSVAFTPASGELPTEVRATGPLGAGWTTTVTQDPARGSVLTNKDINDRVTTAQYDAMGRTKAVWTPDRPTGGLPSKKFTYSVKGTLGPSAITTESINDDAVTYSASIDILDGLGRPRQSQSTSAAKPTGRLITDTLYDTHGWVIKTSNPYYEKGSFPTESIFVPLADGQVPGQTWNVYDGNGRVVRSEFRSYGNLQWATTTAYPGADRTDVTPPAGGTPMSVVTDARGRTAASWQYRTNEATGNPADADITTYGYTTGGLTSRRTDSSGNTWSYTYDLRGRQVSRVDPDSGATQTFYDVDSQIDHTTDAKGTTLAYTYDLLGRRTGSYSGSVAPANQLASWSYDTLIKGQPTSSTRYVGGASGAAYTTAVTGYDTAYRPLGTSTTIPAAEGALAGTYTTTNSYSPVIGSLKTTSIPAAGGLQAETVSYGRTITGLLTGATSLGKAVVAKVEYDALARPVRTTAGEYGKQVISTQQYDWATSRVINSFIDKQLGTVAVDQTSYTYTPSGRITSATDIQDAAGVDTQCFSYDHLGRLTGAWTDTGGTSTTADWTDSSGNVHGTGSSTTVPGIGGCKNASEPAVVSPGGRTIGGPAPYWNNYTYDASGNRTGLVQHDIAGNALDDITTSQTFGPAQSTNTPTSAPNTGGGTGGPHALLTSTTTGPGTTKAVSYQYDEKGNTTAITDTGGTTTLAWNGEDRLESVAKTGQSGPTTYLYDADGNQLIRRNPGKTTLNLPTDELTLDTVSGSMSNVRAIAGPGGLTYTRVTAAIGGGKVLIQAADPHGTNGVQINTSAGQPVTRRSTDPFGGPRGTQPAPTAWAGSKGFVGGSKDDTTGLTNLGARQYDPTTGRFISPDPIFDAGDPQQWNGYAYSENNPVNLSDPSGLKSEECGTLYDCGSAGTITMSNAAETTENYVSDSALFRLVDSAPGYKPVRPIGPPPKPKKRGFLDGFKDGFVGAVKGAVQPWTDLKDCVVGRSGDACKAVAISSNPITMSIKTVSGSIDGINAMNDQLNNGEVAYTGGEATAMLLMAVAGRKISKAVEGPCNSFPAGALVLMADGSSRPIEEVKTGDVVTATDPRTGVTAQEPVTDEITGYDDTQFTELTLTTAVEEGAQRAPSGVVSTAHHPYWDETAQKWVDAEKLQPGHVLLSPDHSSVVVAAIRTYATPPTIAHNLTVANLHAYYVLAGATPVLVHNCDSVPGDTYRVDTRGPDEIFPTGFTPRGSNMSLEEHVYGVSGDITPPSGYVATTNSHNYAVSRAIGGKYVYQIRGGPEGIDVNKTLPGNPMSHEREFAVPGRIPTECIVGCHMPDGSFRSNPNYGR